MKKQGTLLQKLASMVFSNKKETNFSSEVVSSWSAFSSHTEEAREDFGSSLFLFPGWHNWCFPVEALRVLMKHVVE